MFIVMIGSKELFLLKDDDFIWFYAVAKKIMCRRKKEEWGRSIPRSISFLYSIDSAAPDGRLLQMMQT